MEKKNLEDYLHLYRGLHSGDAGYKIRGSDELHSDKRGRMFDGSNFYEKLWSHFKEWVVDKGSFRVLDYGCGKAKHLYEPHLEGKTFHQYFKGRCQDYYCYDPGYEKYCMAPPKGSRYDALICADVMEHIPEEHVDSTLETMKNLTHPNGMCFFSISGQPAVKMFEDGENLHCNVQPMEYWTQKLKKLNRRYVMIYTNEKGSTTLKRV